jgi:hypothetical protein
MSYHIGLFDDICPQRWVGFGHWERGYILLRRFRTVYLFISTEFRQSQRHTKYWNGTLVYYLSLSGTGNVGDVTDS